MLSLTCRFTGVSEQVDGIRQLEGQLQLRSSTGTPCRYGRRWTHLRWHSCSPCSGLQIQFEGALSPGNSAISRYGRLTLHSFSDVRDDANPGNACVCHPVSDGLTMCALLKDMVL